MAEITGESASMEKRVANVIRVAGAIRLSAGRGPVPLFLTLAAIGGYCRHAS